jgi:hypothetical protein
LLTPPRDNEQRTREAVGKDGKYVVTRNASDHLLYDYVLRQYFRFCQKPNCAEIEALAFVTGNSEKAVGDWCK